MAVRRSLSATLLLALSVTSCTWRTASATSYFVSHDNGDDSNAGTSSTAAFATLRRLSTVAFQPGDQLLLERGQIWFDEVLELNNPTGLTVGAYGVEGAPRPFITMPRSNTQASTCVTVRNPTDVTVQDVHVGGCGTGIAVTAGTSATGANSSGVVLQRNYFTDIESPMLQYTPPNPAWATAIVLAPGTNGFIENVTVRNNIGLRVDVFFSTNVYVDGLSLDANTVTRCRGNCVGMTNGVNMHLTNSVFLRDNSERLFLYGTTDVILGTIEGDNSIENNDFNARGEMMGGPDGCAIDMETSAKDFRMVGNTISHSYGAGIMVFGHQTTSQGLLFANNTFIRDGCIQQAGDHGEVGFMCPNGHQPTGTVQGNHFITCPGVPAMFDNRPGCSSAIKKIDNRINQDQVTPMPMLNVEPLSPTSNATSGTMPIVARFQNQTNDTVFRYTIDGSSPTEASPVLPAGGYVFTWPGPAFAINVRAYEPGMLPSVANGLVFENNYVQTRMAPRKFWGLGSSTFDGVTMNASGVFVTGWAVDTALPRKGWLPVDIEITINGTIVAAIGQATVDRPDLVKAGVAPNADHGFSFELAAEFATMLKAPGKHSIGAWAINSPSSTTPHGLSGSPKCLQNGAAVPC